LPLSLSDVIALSSVGLGASALGLAIDAIMSPRLERFRDSLLAEAERAQAAGTSASERLQGEKKLATTVETVKTYYDDLDTKRFSTELRCLSFFNGSIVRALLVALAAQTVVVFLATLHGMLLPMPLLDDLIYFIPDECEWLPEKNLLSSLFASECNGGMSIFALISSTVIAYTTYCLWKYLRLWEIEHRQLTTLQSKLKTASSEIAIYSRLAEFASVAKK
jgi:hypothetical protein